MGRTTALFYSLDINVSAIQILTRQYNTNIHRQLKAQTHNTNTNTQVYRLIMTEQKTMERKPKTIPLGKAARAFYIQIHQLNLTLTSKQRRRLNLTHKVTRCTHHTGVTHTHKESIYSSFPRRHCH